MAEIPEGFEVVSKPDDIPEGFDVVFQPESGPGVSQELPEQQAEQAPEPEQPGMFARAVDALRNPPERPEPAGTLGTVRAGLRGLTLGTSDEIGSAVAAGVASLTQGVPFDEAYESILGSVQQEAEQFREEYPITATGAEIAGAVGTGGATLARFVPQAAGVLPRVAAASGLGAAEGALLGAASAPQGERLEGAGTGAVIGAVAGPALNEGLQMFARRSALKDKAAQLISEGSTDGTTAQYMLDGAGQIRTDPIAREAIRQGFEPSVIASVKGSSSADRAKMRQMVDIVDRGRNNARFASTNRASDVAGDSVRDRIMAVRSINREAGREVDQVARSLKGIPVDVTDPVERFTDDLADMGIEMVNNRPVFDGSDLEGLDGPQRVIANVVKRMRETRAPDAFDVHRMKRFIDEQVTYGKNADGLTGQAERILKGLRRNLDGLLDSQFPAYNVANQRYSDTIQALDAFQSVAGRKMDLDGPNANRAIGTLSRRLLSNAQSRVPLMDSINQLDSVARRYGQGFDDDIITQVMFVDELESMFPPPRRTTFRGEIADATRRSAEFLRGGPIEQGLAMLEEANRRAKNIHDDAAMQSIREVLAE